MFCTNSQTQTMFILFQLYVYLNKTFLNQINKSKVIAKAIFAIVTVLISGNAIFIISNLKLKSHKLKLTLKPCILAMTKFCAI